MAAKPFCFLIAAGLLVGCAVQPEPVPAVQTVYVDKPVAVRREPPADLVELRRNLGPLPQFVAPTDEAATSALTPEGERRLRALLDRLATGLEAWEAWAGEGAP